MVRFLQFEYPPQLYHTEVLRHADNFQEYKHEVLSTLINSINLNRPNLELYLQQPYLTFAIRNKLIDFLLKMSIRLKILPFVFFRAVKIFDRYCLKRVVLLDQLQLIITTCLWIAAKVQGGNNHFVNLSNVGKLTDIKTITDLGYGLGGRYLGPTERFRLPKLHELVKLCGAKCKYDQGMFKQMELHVLLTLEWSLNDPSVEEFLMRLVEFNIVNSESGEGAEIVREIIKTKEYLAYVSLYSNELIDVDVIDLSKAICQLTNEMLNLTENGGYFQRINYVNEASQDDDFFYETSPSGGSNNALPIKHSTSKLTTSAIRQNLIKAIMNSSEFILKLFESAGPQQVFNAVMYKHSNNNHNRPIAVCNTSNVGEYLQHPRHQFNNNVSPSSPLRYLSSSLPLRSYHSPQSLQSNTSGATTPSGNSTFSLTQPPIRKRPITSITLSTSSSSTISIATLSSLLTVSTGGTTASSINTTNSYKKSANHQHQLIPPPHQLPSNFNAFPTINEAMYEPVVLPLVLLKTNAGSGLAGASARGVSGNNDDFPDLTPQNSKFPMVNHHIVNHAHNNSQASLHSQCSSRNDHGSIFEYESTNANPCHVGTPLSEDDSPLHPMIRIK